MISKEDFMKVWKDTSRENILNQFYHDYKTLREEYEKWDKLKKFVKKDIKRWEEEEKKWIEQGFMKFGGEANNKIIFKKVLDKMQELEGNNE